MHASGKLIFVLAVVVLFSACASAGVGRSTLLDSQWQPAPGQVCQLISTPHTLPEPDAILPSSAAHEALAPIRSASAQVEPYVVLEVRFDSTGQRSNARVVETNAAEAADRLLENVAGRAPSSVSAGAQGWGVLIRAAARPETAEVTIGRMEYCACGLANRHQIMRRLTRIVEESPLRLLGSKYQLVIDVHTDSNGGVLERRLHQSTGSPDVDLLIFRAVEDMAILPPLLNRRPVQAWSRLPIVIDFGDHQADSLAVRRR